MDAVREANGEVINMNYNEVNSTEYFNILKGNKKEKRTSEYKYTVYQDITQGLPLLGLRVMLNPERLSREYTDEIKGKSGTITNIQGSESGAKGVIREYKRNGESSSWMVRVKFDGGITRSINIYDLLPIMNTGETIHHVSMYESGDYYLTEEDYQSKIDEWIIIRGDKIKRHTIWDNEMREKFFNES